MNRRPAISILAPCTFSLGLFVANCGGQSSYTAPAEGSGGRTHTTGSGGQPRGGSGGNSGGAVSGTAGGVGGQGGSFGNGASAGTANIGAATGTGGTGAGGADSGGEGGMDDGPPCLVEGVSRPVSDEAFETRCGTCRCTPAGLVCSIQSCLDVCSTLAQAYQTELVQAATCNPAISRPQCTILANRGLQCSCPGYIESSAALERAESARTAWEKARCMHSEVACAPCAPVSRQSCNPDLGTCY